MTDTIFRFFRSADFSKGVVLALAILSVLAASYWLDNIQVGISLTLGMFISAPANSPGSNRHRVNGMLAAILLAMVSTVIINLAFGNLWLFVPVMAGLIFLISYLSVFGFRASLVSFSGLLAIILSLAHPRTGAEVFTHTTWIGLGGLWYLVFSLLIHLWTHKSHTLIMMSDCMRLTSSYLRIRGEMALNKGNKDELQRKLLELQIDINNKHENLREVLLSSSRNSGQSNFSRRQVLILIELIDILELAIGNLPHVFKMRESFNQRTAEFQPFADLIFAIADHLDYLSTIIGTTKTVEASPSIEALLQRAKESLGNIRETAATAGEYEEFLLLKNIYGYLQKQSQKIEIIQNVMRNLVEQEQLWSRSKYSSQFITAQDYDWKTFTENFNFDSPIFKHSLRLTLTVVVGFFIGIFFPFQNAYWILLTIIVIMRPGYTLTQERSRHRLLGTLIGGAIAVAVVLITQNVYVFGILAILTFIMGFSLVQKNYKSSAIFITLNVVFMYSLLRSDPLDAIQFRVVDTLTGAALAFLANSFFWPSWQFLNIREFITAALKSNRNFLYEINKFYLEKNPADPSYKLRRKAAFLAIGNLSAAFQRMSQEPKEQQKELDKIYELVVLNNTFLSLTASLGTYIRNNKTTKASTYFQNYINSIAININNTISVLEQEDISDGPSSEFIQEAQEYLDLQYEKLSDQYEFEEDESIVTMVPQKMQEIKIISDQLKWMLTLSENIKATVGSISF